MLDHDVNPCPNAPSDTYGEMRHTISSQPPQFEPPVHPLRMASAFIDPLWFNAVRGRTHDAEVATDGTVTIEREVLLFSGAALPAGTQVRVSIHRDISCVTQVDWTHAALARQAAHDAERAADAARRDARRLDAESQHRALKLPVRYTAGQKDVLSGLTETSWGDGRNRATVNHLLLLEPLHMGNLRRAAGDLLCTTAKGTNGRRYGNPEVIEHDGAGRPFMPTITCRRCLELAKRWTSQ